MEEGHSWPAVLGPACGDLGLDEFDGPGQTESPDWPLAAEVDLNSTVRAQRCDNMPTQQWLPSRQHTLANPWRPFRRPTVERVDYPSAAGLLARGRLAIRLPRPVAGPVA